MRLTVNGETVEFEHPPSVTQVLERFDLRGVACAVEVNRSVVPHREHGEHLLRDGDAIEIVTLVGGG